MNTLPQGKILVPVDFSPRSTDAVEYAMPIAKRFGSELIILHVMEPLSIDFAMVEPSRALLQDFTSDRERALKRQLGALGAKNPLGVPVRRLLLEGDPAVQIVACSQSENVSLIIMPTQGRSRVRQFLIGSVTAKVLHDADAPVLTGVHLEQIKDFPVFGVRNLLCAVDLGRQSEAVMKMTRDLAQEYGANTMLLHVAEPGSGVEKTIEELLRSTGLTASVQIENGEPSKVVSEAAARLQADLVIIGRGSSNTMIGRLRAQAYAIVRQSPCPVLSV